MAKQTGEMNNGRMKNISYLKNPEKKLRLKNGEISLSELLFYAAVIINVGCSSSYSLYSILSSRLTMMSMLLAAGIIVASGATIELDVKAVIALILFIGISMLVILVNHSGFGVLLFSLWPLVIIFVLMNLPMSPFYLDILGLIMAATWAYGFVQSSRYSSYYFSNMLMMVREGTINPNTTAALTAMASLYVGMFLVKNRFSKAWLILVYGLSLGVIYRTRSRGVLIAYFAVLAVELLFKRLITRCREFALFVLSAAILSGLLFPVLYVYLYKQGIITYEMELNGKSLLTGRQFIWLNLWSYLKGHKSAFIWGVGYNTTIYANGSFNLHNAYLQLFAQFGTLIFAIFLWFILWSVYRMYAGRGLISEVQFKCYEVVLLVLLIGLEETILTYFPFELFYAAALGIGIRESLEGG